MSPLLEHVARSVQTRRLFEPGARILVAVSGGVDSMVLLDLLHRLSSVHSWRLTVAHLNHQLRGRSSSADERLVRSAAQRLQLPIIFERADVRRFAREHKFSIEMAARELRHSFLARAARQARATAVALAHHADDQVEVFFLRLLRGSGTAALGGMKWRAPSPASRSVTLVRPLLDQPKAALQEYAQQHKLAYREDASNACLDFQRNRIRHELLPLLRKEYQPALARVTARLMDVLGAEADAITAVAAEWLQGQMNLSPTRGAQSGRRADNARAINIPFSNLPIAVQRRCLQLQLFAQGIAPDYDLIERLRLTPNCRVSVGGSFTLDGGCCPKPSSVSLDNGISTYPWPGTEVDWAKMADKGRRQRPGDRGPATRVTRNGAIVASAMFCYRDLAGRLHVEPGSAFQGANRQVVIDGGSGQAAFGNLAIAWSILSHSPKPLKSAPGIEYFDADEVGSPVILRHWQPGDRFQPIGMAKSVKLQDFFVNQKVPRAHRRGLVLATTKGGEIFWVQGQRIAERFKLTKATIRRLQWSWQSL